MANAINTKTAQRRPLDFQDLSAVLADLDDLEAAEAAGTLTRHGNWSLGQNAGHIAALIEQSLDGFRFKAPLTVRVIFTAGKKFFLGRPFPSGIQLQGPSRMLLPEGEVSTAEGCGALRTQIGRVLSGERMTQRSPIFGKLTHEQWVGLHCRHANLHLSFLDPGA